MIRTSLQMVKKLGITLAIAVLVAACAAPPRVTTTHEIKEGSETGFDNILVLVLFSKFDSRRYLEDEIVKHLAANGVQAVASTSMMTSETLLNRKFILETMTELGSDALLFTQLADLRSTGKVKDMSPEATYNIRPTYYVNVFSVDLQEYLEPQNVIFTSELSTATDMYSFATKEKIWGVTTYSKIKGNEDHMRDYSVIVAEANAIVSSLLDTGVVSD